MTIRSLFYTDSIRSTYTLTVEEHRAALIITTTTTAYIRSTYKPLPNYILRVRGVRAELRDRGTKRTSQPTKPREHRRTRTRPKKDGATSRGGNKVEWKGDTVMDEGPQAARIMDRWTAIMMSRLWTWFGGGLGLLALLPPTTWARCVGEPGVPPALRNVGTGPQAIRLAGWLRGACRGAMASQGCLAVDCDSSEEGVECGFEGSRSYVELVISPNGAASDQGDGI